MYRWSHGLAAIAGLSTIVIPTLAPVQASDLPPYARPGECYGQVLTPPVYGKVERKVLEQEGWTETARGAPTYEKVTKKVLVKPERVVKVRDKPVYKEVVRWVTKPGKKRVITEPARYEIVRKKVLVEEGHAEWRPADAPLSYGERRSSHQTELQATGEVWCRVWVPARYDYVKKKVKVASGRTYTVVGKPTKHKVVERVLVKEGGWIEKKLPAVYRTDVVKTLVHKGHEKVIHHPPVYRTIKETKLVQPEKRGWARVVCASEIAPEFMSRVQQALIASGYDAGEPDGYGHPETYAALRSYQRDHNLAQGQLTVETARRLGVM